MGKKQSTSKHMLEAQKLLATAKEAPLNLEEREKKAIQLAALILSESNRCLTKKEKKRYGELSRMMHDPIGKVFITTMTDQCFRSHSPKRIADQMIYLLNLYGIPKFFSKLKRLQLYFFKMVGAKFANILVPIAIYTLRKETASVIIPGEKSALSRHIKKRKAEGIRLNLNHLGEAILGEEEAVKRLNIYLEDLKHPHIDYVSVKISTIYSQIHLLSWEKSLQDLKERLRTLYRAAMENKTTLKDGKES